MANSAGAATYDSLNAEITFLKEFVKTAAVYSPIVTKYMKAVPSMGSRIEFDDQDLPVTKTTLASSYTAAAGSMTLTAPTYGANYVIKAGVSQVQNAAGTLIFPITAYNSGTNVITLGTAIGTDVNLASGATVMITRSSQVGENFGSQNDTLFATADYNYISNFSYTLFLSNLHEQGRLINRRNEMSFANQFENNMPQAVSTLEIRAMKDVRTQGTGAATRNSNVIQSGDGAHAGGILNLASARGMYTASSGTSPISEDVLETDIRTLRRRGAFTTPSGRVRDKKIGKTTAYCSENTLAQINKMTRLERAPEAYFGLSDKEGGYAGTWCTGFLVNGVVVDFEVSDAMADNEIVYIPREDLIDIQILRMAEEQERLPGGDNVKSMIQFTYSVAVRNPWLLGYRSNLSY